MTNINDFSHMAKLLGCALDLGSLLASEQPLRSEPCVPLPPPLTVTGVTLMLL